MSKLALNVSKSGQGLETTCRVFYEILGFGTFLGMIILKTKSMHGNPICILIFNLYKPLANKSVLT